MSNSNVCCSSLYTICIKLKMKFDLTFNVQHRYQIFYTTRICTTHIHTKHESKDTKYKYLTQCL